MTKATLSLVLLLIAPGRTAAQSSADSWDNLRQLRSGQRIEVVGMKLNSWQGAFTGYSGEAISLRTSEDEVAIPRADVLSVKNRERSHRVRNALLGLAIGAGAGAGIGAAMPAGEVTVYRAKSQSRP